MSIHSVSLVVQVNGQFSALHICSGTKEVSRLEVEMFHFDRLGKWGGAFLLGGSVTCLHGYALYLSNSVVADSGKPDFGGWIAIIAATSGLLRGIPLALLLLVFAEHARHLRPFIWIPLFGMLFPFWWDVFLAKPDELHMRIALSLVGGVVFAGVTLAGLHFARLHLLKLNQGVLTNL